MRQKIRVKSEELSDRECQVVDLLCTGMSTSEIADRLFISKATVRSHIEHIRSKLHARNRIQVVVIYINGNRHA